MPPRDREVKITFTADEDVTAAIEKIEKAATRANANLISMSDGAQRVWNRLISIMGEGSGLEQAAERAAEKFIQGLAGRKTSAQMRKAMQGMGIDAAEAIASTLQEQEDKVVAARDRLLGRAQEGFLQASQQAANRRAQSEAAAEEAYLRRVEAGAARLAAVAERSEVVRTQAGARGAQQRLQRMAETEEQMTRQIQAASRDRDRVIAQAALTEARSVMQSAQQRLADVRAVSGVEEQVVTAAEKAMADATTRYEQARTTVTQQQAAERTRIEQEAAAAQSNVARQMAAERVAIASGAGGAGGGGGGGGGLGGLLGGFGGFGGFMGGAASLAGRGIQGALGVGGNILGGIGGFLGGAAQAGVSALMAPVQALLGVFQGLGSVISNTTGELAHFVQVGLGVYTVYEIVQTLENAFKSLVGGAVEFQDKLIQVQSLRFGDTMVQNMQEVSDGVVELSMKTGRSAVELGNALFFVEGHGYGAADSMKILDQAAMLAASGLGQTDQLVRIATGAMVAYGASADKASYYFDTLALTEQKAALPLGELAGQFQRIVPVAAALHIPFEQVGAAIATVSRTGLNAGRVLTDLTGVLNSFVHSTPQQEAALTRIGYPLEQLRKDISDPQRGLIYVMRTLWERSAHDIDAAGSIFGDRARALIGFLAAVRNGGEDVQDIMDKMAAALQKGGVVTELFQVNLARVSLQLDRLKAVMQGFVILASETVLPAIAKTLDPIISYLSQGQFVHAFDLAGKAISDVANGIVQTFTNLGNQMFGAGFSIISELAKGIMDAANSVLNAVVQGVASLIAGFLLGSSPPPMGPLHYIQQGVMAWHKDYATAMLEGGMVLAGTAERVATAVNEQYAKIGGGAGDRKGIEAQIANIDRQLLPWKLAVDQITESYNAMLHPLERQIEMIRNIKDVEYERQQLKFRERDMELAMLKLRAEGDPARRAILAGQIARQQEVAERHSIDREIESLQRQSRELGRQRMTPQERRLAQQEISDRLTMLGLRRAEHALVNPQLLAEYYTKKSTLDFDKQGAQLRHEAWELQKDMTLQPLIEEHDKIKAQMQSELDFIKAQTDALEDQRKVLQTLLSGMPGGAGAGGGAHPWQVDQDELIRINRENTERAVNEMVTNLRTRIGTGLKAFWEQRGTEIGQAVVGGVAGYMVAGLPGALFGAQFLPALVQELEKQGVTQKDFERFANNFTTGLHDALVAAQKPLAAGDVLGSVEAFAASVGQWLKGLEGALFRVWYTRPTAIGGGQGEGLLGQRHGEQQVARIGTEVVPGQQIIDEFGRILGTEAPGGATRRVGLGRMIIESLFGEQDASLNYQVAYGLVKTNVIDPIWKAITDWWDRFTMPHTDPALPQGVTLPSNAELLGKRILGMFSSAFKWVGTNVGPLAEDAGQALVNVVNAALTYATTNEDAKRTMGDAWENLGVQVGGRFLEGIRKAFAATPFGKFLAAAYGWTDPIGVRGAAVGAVTGGAVNPLDPVGARGAAGRATEGIDLTDPLGIRSAISGSDWFKAGTTAITSFFGGVTKQLDSSEESKPTWWYSILVRPALDALDIHSPSGEYERMGEGAIEGFQNAFKNDTTTGAIVRLWATSNVLSQARSILVTGVQAAQAGRRGGFAGVADDAIDAMNDVFAQGVPSGLQNNLTLFGGSMAYYVMQGFTDSKSGLAARMKQYYATLPPPPPPSAPAPAPTPPGEGPTGPRGAYATGGEFIVGGRGGTDSTPVSFWATPGEHVAVTPAGQSGGAINVNAPLIQGVTLENGADPQLDVMLDRVRDFLVNDIRTARGQGVSRPAGITPRGAR